MPLYIIHLKGTTPVSHYDDIMLEDITLTIRYKFCKTV